MTRKRKRRGGHRFEISRDAHLGIAWYSRDAWERLRQVADDVGALDENYDAWERGALAAVRELESVGRPVQKVPIDIDALIAWCRERKRSIDSAARAEYVTTLLRRDERARSGGKPAPLQITWDPLKAEANIAKHAVTFSEAATVLLDPLALQPEGSAPAEVRIISAREATRRERNQYENEPR